MRSGAAAALVLVLSGCRVPGVVTERFFSKQENGLPRAEDCERCHREVYLEWRDSLHAHAWTSEAFQQASAQARGEECTSCHAPAPLDAAEPVRLRSAHRDEGVTCVTCHLSPRPADAPLTMRGPVSRSSPVEIHPVIEADPLYRSSELCGTCHRTAFEEWRGAAAPADGPKPTCQECHMPAVQRKVESVNEDVPYSRLLVAFQATQPLRRHVFRVPDDAAEHLDLEVEPAAGRTLAVTLGNRLYHGLPTGGFGRRAIRIVASWPGGQAERTLVRAREAALRPGEERRFLFELPRGVQPSEVAVALERWNHERNAWERLLPHDEVSSRSP